MAGWSTNKITCPTFYFAQPWRATQELKYCFEQHSLWEEYLSFSAQSCVLLCISLANATGNAMIRWSHTSELINTCKENFVYLSEAQKQVNTVVCSRACSSGGHKASRMSKDSMGKVSVATENATQTSYCMICMMAEEIVALTFKISTLWIKIKTVCCL